MRMYIFFSVCYATLSLSVSSIKRKEPHSVCVFLCVSEKEREYVPQGARMTSPIWASRLLHSPHADCERKKGGTEEKQKEGRKRKDSGESAKSFDWFAMILCSFSLKQITTSDHEHQTMILFLKTQTVDQRAFERNI